MSYSLSVLPNLGLMLDVAVPIDETSIGWREPSVNAKPVLRDRF